MRAQAALGRMLGSVMISLARSHCGYSYGWTDVDEQPVRAVHGTARTQAHRRAASGRTHHLVAGEGGIAEVEEEAHEHRQRHLPQERAEEEDGAPDQAVDRQACVKGGSCWWLRVVVVGRRSVSQSVYWPIFINPRHPFSHAPVRRFSVMDSITTSPSSFVLKRASALTWFRLWLVVVVGVCLGRARDERCVFVHVCSVALCCVVSEVILLITNTDLRTVAATSQGRPKRELTKVRAAITSMSCSVVRRDITEKNECVRERANASTCHNTHTSRLLFFCCCR